MEIMTGTGFIELELTSGMVCSLKVMLGLVSTKLPSWFLFPRIAGGNPNIPSGTSLEKIGLEEMNYKQPPSV